MAQRKPYDPMIYGLVDPRTLLVRYVGQTRRGLQRARKHKYTRDYTHKGRWIQQLLTLGTSFEIAVLERCAEDRLDEAERWWIAYGRASGWSLTNHTEGGEGGYRFDEATCAKIGAKHLGMRHTVDARLRMSRSHTGKVLSDEHRASLRAAAKRGVPRPDIVTAKISATKRGMKFGADHRAKLSAAATRRWARRRGADADRQ